MNHAVYPVSTRPVTSWVQNRCVICFWRCAEPGECTPVASKPHYFFKTKLSFFIWRDNEACWRNVEVVMLRVVASVLHVVFRKNDFFSEGIMRHLASCSRNVEALPCSWERISRAWLSHQKNKLFYCKEMVMFVAVDLMWLARKCLKISSESKLFFSEETLKHAGNSPQKSLKPHFFRNPGPSCCSLWSFHHAYVFWRNCWQGHVTPCENCFSISSDSNASSCWRNKAAHWQHPSAIIEYFFILLNNASAFFWRNGEASRLPP